jgi:hypothetical protein
MVKILSGTSVVHKTVLNRGHLYGTNQGISDTV